jgi:hypothetical protein
LEISFECIGLFLRGHLQNVFENKNLVPKVFYYHKKRQIDKNQVIAEK